MATKEETRARLESLKKDQETLKRELAELDTFMEKKARASKAHYERPQQPPYHERPGYSEPPRYPYHGPSYSNDEMYELMRRNLSESKKMMDKFDYLLDTLISSTEEVEGDNTDDLIKALAQSQMHVMDVLAGIKTAMDKASEEAATKKELDGLERDQISQYQELNKKVGTLMEQMQNPPYLQELDQIRVQVANLQGQLARLQKEGLKAGGVSDEFKGSVKALKTQADALAERMGNINSSLENISEHINQVQATTAQLAELKQQIAKMRDMLSAKDDQMLNDTQMKITQLESRMAELNSTVSRLKDIEGRMAKLPVGELSKEVESLKASLPSTSLKDLRTKLDKIEKKLEDSLKKKQNEEEDREILLRLVKKEAELSDKVGEVSGRVSGGEAAETYARQALENKISALEKLVASASHYGEAKSLQHDVEAVRAELKRLKRQLKSVEVIETYSRMRDKAESIQKLKALEGRLNDVSGMLNSRIKQFEELLNSAEEKAEASNPRKAIEKLREEMGHTEEEAEKATEKSESAKEMLKKQAARLAEVESEFDEKTSTLERELMSTEEFFKMRHKQREEKIKAQLEQLRGEIIKAREAAKEVPPDLAARISKLYAEMEKMKHETPEELKALASQISAISQTMDEVQHQLRNGKADKKKIEELSAEVEGIYLQVSALSEDASRSHELLARINAMEKALQQAKALKGRELETAVGAIKRELSDLSGKVEGIKEGEKSLDREVESVHSTISELEKKTRDEIYARMSDLKSQVASSEDLGEIKKALAAMEKRLEKEEGMEEAHSHIALAKQAAENGNLSVAKGIVKSIAVPKHVVVVPVVPGKLKELEESLEGEYSELASRVHDIREEYESKGMTSKLKEELMYLEEDLLDFWIDRRGLSEALLQARHGNIEEAKKLLEYERSVLEDLKLDINSLRMKAKTLPKEAINKAEKAIARREAAEEELSAIDALKESVERMKREREQLHREMEAAKQKSIRAIVPEKAQESLELAKSRPTPAVGKAVQEMERELSEKRVVPITQHNLDKARDKLGELAGRAKQIEYGTGDPLAKTAKEKLERARQMLSKLPAASSQLKQMVLVEELGRMKQGRISIAELARRAGIPESEARALLPSIVGDYALSGGFVEKPKAI